MRYLMFSVLVLTLFSCRTTSSRTSAAIPDDTGFKTVKFTITRTSSSVSAPVQNLSSNITGSVTISFNENTTDSAPISNDCNRYNGYYPINQGLVSLPHDPSCPSYMIKLNLKSNTKTYVGVGRASVKRNSTGGLEDAPVPYYQFSLECKVSLDEKEKTVDAPVLNSRLEAICSTVE